MFVLFVVVRFCRVKLLLYRYPYRSRDMREHGGDGEEVGERDGLHATSFAAVIASAHRTRTQSVRAVGVAEISR
jgi:hypothetical protein